MANTVENMEQGIVLDDAVQAPVDQETETLSSLLEDAEQPTQQPETEQAPVKEPGWIKGRINKEVAKAEARIRAEYEAKLAPIRESMMDREAQELVRNGEFKTLNMAKEYVRLKNGVPAEQTDQQQPTGAQRDAQGRFAAAQDQSEQNDPVVLARADLLAKQAQKIKQSTGLDVMQAFSSNPEIRQRVISGEWDFRDVADHLSAQGEGSSPRRVPTPMRSPNGANVSAVSVSDMSPEQFQKLQDNLASGRRYDMSK